MPLHEMVHTVDYRLEDMYNLIIDIERYPEFLPWISAARIIDESDDMLVADLIISFKIFSEHYRSRVELSPPKNGKAEINVSLISGPFSHLTNQWHLKRLKENKTRISFVVDFKLKSALLDSMIGVLFSKACQKMVTAFENRAKELYRPGKDEPRSPKRNRNRTKNA
jgi:coenzyme Q-binding protein COQ10